MERGSITATQGPSTTRGVERVCALLSAFTPQAPQLTLGELTALTDLPKATVYRLAGSLVTTGFLRHSDDGHYALAMKISELGAIARPRVDVVETCAPVLDRLADEAGETVLLGKADWDQLELTIVGGRVNRNDLSVVPPVGRRMTISPGAIGKALLMGLPDDERDRVLARLPLEPLTGHTCTDPHALALELKARQAPGYVEVLDEFADGVAGVAVPVLFDFGWPRAAIGVVGPSFRIAGALDRLGSLLLDATGALRLAAETMTPAFDEGVTSA